MTQTKCEWRKLAKLTHPLEMQPYRYMVACNGEVARGAQPIYPDICPGCNKPVVICLPPSENDGR